MKFAANVALRGTLPESARRLALAMGVHPHHEVDEGDNDNPFGESISLNKKTRKQNQMKQRATESFYRSMGKETPRS